MTMFRITLLVGAAALAIFAFFPDASSTDRLARDIVARCAEEIPHAKCYEREMPALLTRLALPEVFEVIRHIRKQDPSYQFCHVLAHKIGEIVVAKDPDRWLDAIPYNPLDGLCSNGFIHGVISGRFSADVLDERTREQYVPDFSRACEPRGAWQPTQLDRAMCYHGLGHLYLFITDADIPKALDLCERTAAGADPKEDFRRVCREGVFMQIYQQLDPDDDFLVVERTSVRPTKKTVRQFCARFERDEYKGACLRESWPLFREEIMNGTGIAAFCADQPHAAEETACYESVFAIVGRLSLEKPEHIADVCGHVPEERAAMCWADTAATILEEDRHAFEHAIDLCNSAPERYQTPCLETLAERTSFIFGNTPDATHFCAMLPEYVRTMCRL